MGRPGCRPAERQVTAGQEDQTGLGQFPGSRVLEHQPQSMDGGCLRPHVSRQTAAIVHRPSGGTLQLPGPDRRNYQGSCLGQADQLAYLEESGQRWHGMGSVMSEGGRLCGGRKSGPCE